MPVTQDGGWVHGVAVNRSNVSAPVLSHVPTPDGHPLAGGSSILHTSYVDDISYHVVGKKKNIYARWKSSGNPKHLHCLVALYVLTFYNTFLILF